MVDNIHIVQGDIIQLAMSGNYDVVVHGCNCFCRQRRGLAPQMALAFGTHKFSKEDVAYVGYIDKLGSIDYEHMYLPNNNELIVVNAYTQYHWELPSVFGIPLDYDALNLCLTKINRHFKGKHVLLPKIGCGLAKGDWVRVYGSIRTRLVDCDVTVVEYNK